MRSIRTRWAAIGLLAAAVPSPAWATYSPPLTQVRIDVDRISHTPSLVYASEQRTTGTTDLTLTGWGAQYLGQFEWASGFGLQVGAAIGPGGVDGTLGAAEATTNGFWVGGQFRAYQMLWKSSVVDETVERPSALTAFINVRALYYQTSGDGQAADVSFPGAVDLRFASFSGGAGLMAEWSISDYVSICPYAWVTPGFGSDLDYTLGDIDIELSGSPTFRNPFLVGVDIWVYPFPPDWTDHISLSILGSFVDTEGDDRTLAVVIGYTF